MISSLPAGSDILVSTPLANRISTKHAYQTPQKQVSNKKHCNKTVKRATPAELDQRVARLQNFAIPWNSMHAFQQEAVRFALERCGRVLLADSMGLGKTVQAIALAAAYGPEDWPLLVVTPPSMALTWRNEIIKWLPPSLQPAEEDLVVFKSGAQREVETMLQRVRSQEKANSAQAEQPPRVVIVSFSMIIKDDVKSSLRKLGSNCIIVDESHSVKSLGSQRTRAVTDFVQQAKRAILISGTPTLSRPIEIFPQVDMLHPGLLGTFDEFGMKYCDGKAATSWQYATSPSTTMDYRGITTHRLEELRTMLQSEIMIRRTKTEVDQDLKLPDKIRHRVIVQIESPYREELQNIKAEMKFFESQIGSGFVEGDAADLQRLTLMTKLFKVSGVAKVPQVLSHVCGLLERGEKIAVFGHHKEVLDALELGITKHLLGGPTVGGETAGGGDVNQFTDQGGDGDVKLKPKITVKKTRKGETKKRRRSASDDDEDYVPNLSEMCPNPRRKRQEVPARSSSRRSASSKRCQQPTQQFLPQEHLPRCVRLDGSTSMGDRQAAVDAFQNDNTVRAAILSTKAAGVGISLTAASMVVFAELIWTPGDLIQAEDRAHRIGQSSALEVHYVTAPGSIDDLMWGTVMKKVDVIHSVLGNGDPEMENEFAGMQFLRRLTEKMERQV